MTKSERRTFFERLCQLRETYRATRHTSTRMTVEAAIAYAEAALAEDVVIELDPTPLPKTQRRAA
jgi:hypothetical protein